LQHSDFVTAWKAGKLQVHVERAKALQILADPAVAPASTRRSQLLWTWLWILSVPAALAVMYFYRWWAGLLLLATVTPALGLSTKKSTRQLMIDRVLADSDFYDYAIQAGIVHVREKSQG
jgi:hypothetical protein